MGTDQGVDLMATREEKMDGLRELLDWLDANPEFPVPFWLTYEHTIYADDEADLLAKRKILGRQVDKVVGNQKFGFSRKFGPIDVEVVIARDVVCERKVVGTREIPATEARTEDIVEWVCPESFLVKLGENV
jgi:hypothetical protein